MSHRNLRGVRAYLSALENPCNDGCGALIKFAIGE